METLIFLAVLMAGIVLLTAITLKTILLVLHLGFWALALPLKILAALTAGVFSLLFTMIAPIVVLIVVVGLGITLPLLVLIAIPCLLIGLGACLLVTCFC